MNKVLISSLLVFAFLVLRTAAYAADSKDIEQHLNAKYAGKVLALRQFYTADSLRYNEDGVLKSKSRTGIWTLYAKITIRTVYVRGDMLRIEGVRTAMIYDQKKRDFDVFRTDLPVQIDIQYPSGMADEKTIEQAMTKVFTTPKDDFSSLLPPLWQLYFQMRTASPPGGEPACSPPQGVFQIKKDNLSAPKFVSKVDPQYTEIARTGRVEGRVALCVVIQHDGTVNVIGLLQPVGLGLDEAAAEAAGKWRFQPAVKDGTPVDALATIEVNFKLLPR